MGDAILFKRFSNATIVSCNGVFISYLVGEVKSKVVASVTDVLDLSKSIPTVPDLVKASIILFDDLEVFFELFATMAYLSGADVVGEATCTEAVETAAFIGVGDLEIARDVARIGVVEGLKIDVKEKNMVVAEATCANLTNADAISLNEVMVFTFSILKGKKSIREVFYASTGEQKLSMQGMAIIESVDLVTMWIHLIGKDF